MLTPFNKLSSWSSFCIISRDTLKVKFLSFIKILLLSDICGCAGTISSISNWLIFFISVFSKVFGLFLFCTFFLSSYIAYSINWLTTFWCIWDSYAILDCPTRILIFVNCKYNFVNFLISQIYKVIYLHSLQVNVFFFSTSYLHWLQLESKRDKIISF